MSNPTDILSQNNARAPVEVTVEHRDVVMVTSPKLPANKKNMDH
jgi:hypothetical protein